ncbi:ABC transporter permease [Halostagnicola kamekurae]|uniref:NitT/TauT family transport system permease protein n=1 Tax=Halostagnicola kamekurae TaxID=619731 RepID=A0A1I6TS18_9EURY|nr:ABC transporter permease [Halostagnicola kamekurae]SFS91960.1 NitT/TauT family transport system permease protein [Halostagnicola kamekurae]
MAHATLRITELGKSLPEPVQKTGWFVFEWIPIALVAGFWEIISGSFVSSEILPPFSEVVLATWEIIVTGQILPHIQVSLFRVTAGLGMSIIVGVLLGIGMARLQSVENFFEVPLALIYPLPKIALVPLAILWLGVGTATSVLIVFLACLLPIVLNSYNAAQNVDQNLIWSVQMMGMDSWKIPLKVVVPATIPSILTGIRQAIPIAFISLVGAELVASNRGVGFEILRHGQIGNYTSMFAVIVVISLIAFFSVRVYEWGERRLVQWT